MNKTTNYNLNQWEAGDRVLRTDFNSDNAKIDAALAALAAANPCVRLASVTTTAAQQQINLDVSKFDLTQFAKLEVHITAQVENGGGGASVRLNGLDTGYTRYTVYNNPSADVAIGNVPIGAQPSGGAVVLYLSGEMFFGVGYGAAAQSSYVSLSHHDVYAIGGSAVSPATLHTINICSGGSVPFLAGAKITIIGTKR